MVEKGPRLVTGTRTSSFAQPLIATLMRIGTATLGSRRFFADFIGNPRVCVGLAFDFDKGAVFTALFYATLPHGIGKDDARDDSQTANPFRSGESPEKLDDDQWLPPSRSASRALRHHAS